MVSRILILGALATALLLFTGCPKDDSGMLERVEKLEKQLAQKAKALDEQRDETARARDKRDELQKKLDEMKRTRQLATYEFGDAKILKFEVQHSLSQVHVTGKVKNTGEVRMDNVTLKVSFLDETNAQPLERKFVDSHPVPEMQSLSGKHVYFYNVAETLKPGSEREFKMTIHFKNFKGGLDSIYGAIKAYQENGKRVRVALLHGENATNR